MLNLDCMDYMKNCKDNEFDLAIVDPPYGRNSLDGTKTAKYGIKRNDNWDLNRPDKNYFNELFRISKNQIIWGGNYFISELYDTKCVIIMDKSNIPDTFKTMSPIELAWTSFNKPSKIFRVNTNTKNRIHPTQKPVKLYDWLLNNYSNPGDKIIDTHGGSGSSAIACHFLDLDMVWIELDQNYYKSACQRFVQETAQAMIL